MRNSWQHLARPLTEAGLTILAGAIGGPGGAIAASVGREIASQLGVAASPRAVEEAIEQHPADVAKTLKRYEADAGDKLELLAQEQADMARILERADQGPFFRWGWRPAIMWLLAVFWTMNLIGIPVILNGMLGYTIPLAPFDALITLTGLYLALYMGGNTVLRVMGNRGGAA